jgi:hypothetical protein
MLSTRSALNGTSRLSDRDRSSDRPTLTLGMSSLLVVFLILCLVTFAVLTLSGARSDYEFAQRLSNRRQAETAAGNEAQKIRAQVDRRLMECAENGSEPNLADLGVKIEKNRIFWETSVDEGQSLMVELTVTNEGEHYCEITAWKLVSTAERSEDTLPLLNPEGA